MLKRLATLLISSFMLSWGLWGCGSTDATGDASTSGTADSNGPNNGDTGSDSSTDDRFWEGTQDVSYDDDLLEAKAIALAAGESHTCAVTEDKKLACWGRNGAQQAGFSKGGARFPPQLIEEAENVRQVAADVARTVYVSESGAAFCIGACKETTTSTPVALPELEKGVASVHAGWGHICAVMETGQVLCFGSNTHGQSGQPDEEKVFPPKVVNGFSGPVVDLGLGMFHSCAIIEGGAVQCWGLSDDGILGRPDIKGDQISPVTANLEVDAVAIDAADFHTCAVGSDGNLYYWSRGTRGQVVQVTDAPEDIIDVTTSDHFKCILTQTGDVHCEGSGVPIQADKFVKIDGLPDDIVAVDSGRDHVCAMSAAGELWCWGSLSYGQTGSTPISRAFVIPGLTSGVLELSMGEDSVCGRHAHGVRCFYYPRKYTEALNYDEDLADPKRFAQGDDFRCFLDSNDKLVCRGSNLWSQLGDTEITSRSLWGDVEGVPENLTDLTSRGKGSAVLTDDGRVYLVGYANRINDCGNYECPPDEAVFPTEPPLEITALGEGNLDVLDGNCAIKSNGTLACIERDYTGGYELALPFGVDTDAKNIAQGPDHRCWIRSEGAVRCAGRNEYGALGNGVSCEEPCKEEGPYAVSNIDVAVDVAVGEVHSCALQKDGQVKCWGSGPLGDANLHSASTPVVVVGLPGDIVDIDAHERKTCALTSSGAVYCWGSRVFEDYDDILCDWLHCYTTAPKRVLGF